jgi:hypothetical protein
MAEPCCPCGTKPCCGRRDLPATLYLTMTDLVNCTCNDWLGVVIPLSRARHAQNEATNLIWAGCISPGPCTVINGVGTGQSMIFVLTCTVGAIGQSGTPSDFLLQKISVPGEGNPPCPQDLTGIIPNTVQGIGGLMPESTCRPLRLVYRLIDEPLFSVHCQDPMAPPGINEWELTITE